MVRVSRSAEAIPLLVPNDALRRDEARVGALPTRGGGRRGPPGSDSGKNYPRNYLVPTLLLCVAGAMMYAASSKLSAEERADVRARIADARVVRVALLPDTLLATNHDDLRAELQTIAEEGDLGAFADPTFDVSGDAHVTGEISDARTTEGASVCSCRCCVGSGCVLADAGSGPDEPENDDRSEDDATQITLRFDAASPLECDAQACRSTFTSQCPAKSMAGVVTAMFHAESKGTEKRTFESFETSTIGAVFSDPLAVGGTDIYAPPSQEDIDRATTWAEKAATSADAAETATMQALALATEESGLTADEIEAQAAEAAAAAAETLDVAQAPEESPGDASVVADAPEESPEESPGVADAPAESPNAADAPEESPALGRRVSRLGQVVDESLIPTETQNKQVPHSTVVWDATLAANDAASRFDGVALGSIIEKLELDLTFDVPVSLESGETERRSPRLDGGAPHYVELDSDDTEGAAEERILPIRLGDASDDSATSQASASAISGDLGEIPGPLVRREFVPLHAEPDSKRPWTTQVAVVVAHYDEWDSLAEMPVWANNSVDPSLDENAPLCAGYTVAPIYQRRHPDAPNFVPNHGYEGGVYLKFVVDHYDNLPDVAIFLQADADVLEDLPSRLKKVVERQATRGDVTYLPLNAGNDFNPNQVYFHKRDPYQEWWQETSLRGIETCWRNVASWFGTEWGENEAPAVSGYCCNYFAASRENIRKTPLEVWQKAYHQLIELADCGGGPVKDRAEDKWKIGITLEHMAHVMFGGHGPHYPRHCGSGRVGDDSTPPTETPLQATLPDQCCSGDACGAKGWYYAEDTDWNTEPLEDMRHTGLLARVPPVDLAEEQWSSFGYSAQSREAALVGLAANYGLIPYKAQDPEDKVRMWRAAQAELGSFGSAPELWEAAMGAGRSLQAAARAYASMLAAKGTLTGLGVNWEKWEHGEEQ